MQDAGVGLQVLDRSGRECQPREATSIRRTSSPDFEPAAGDAYRHPVMQVPLRDKLVHTGRVSDRAEVLIVDEVERLTTTGLKHLRDLFDRTGIGVILVGMPDTKKRVSRYPQL